MPNLFKAISGEIAATPPGTVFSMSLSATEQAFGGAGQTQTAKFDQVFQQGLAKDDNFFAATGDYGSQSSTQQDKNRNLSNYTAVGYPSTSPFVVAVGGTQLQYNWTWDPTSNDPSTAGYWNWTPGGDTEAVWNESGPDRDRRGRERDLRAAVVAAGSRLRGVAAPVCSCGSYARRRDSRAGARRALRTREGVVSALGT